MSEERLRWALRYILPHPEMTPNILGEEWKISEEKAIDICSSNTATCLIEFDFDGDQMKKLEKDIFKKLKEL